MDPRTRELVKLAAASVIADEANRYGGIAKQAVRRSTYVEALLNRVWRVMDQVKYPQMMLSNLPADKAVARILSRPPETTLARGESLGNLIRAGGYSALEMEGSKGARPWLAKALQAVLTARTDSPALRSALYQLIEGRPYVLGNPVQALNRAIRPFEPSPPKNLLRGII